MVQHIKFLPNIATSTTYEGETARQDVAGIFYACTTIFGVAPVWRLNGPTALVVVDNGSAAPSFFAAKRTNISAMSTTERTCLEGKHSTQQATPCPRKGLFELAEELSEFLLDMPDIDEAQTGLDDMFFGYLCFGDDYDHHAVHDLVWAYKDLQRLLHHARQINEMRQAITIMRNIFRETEKAATGFPVTAEN